MLLITTPQQELDSRNEVACEYVLGPPSELAQACDRSMDFLLGKEMSTGTLASIAKTVKGKFLLVWYCAFLFPTLTVYIITSLYQYLTEVPEEKFIPQWVPWYLRLVDTPAIDRNDEFMDYYLNITDPKNDPGWFDWYLSIRDDEGFTLPNPNGGTFFCIDKEILDDSFSSATLRNCQESWLYEASNPYTSEYEAIAYPSDLFPYNNTNCSTFPTCELDWLDTSINPFSDSGTFGANAFDNDNFFCGVDDEDAQNTCDRPCPSGDLVSCTLL